MVVDLNPILRGAKFFFFWHQSFGISSNSMLLFLRHYVLNRHSRLTVSEPQEDVGRIQRAVTTTELDIDSVKLLATAYTAFEDPEDQHTSSMDPDGGALVITLKPADH